MISTKSIEHSHKLTFELDKINMTQIEVKMILKNNDEEKKVYFFTNIHGPYFSDDDILRLLKGIDAEFTKRFGTDPYSRLIKMKMEKQDD